MTPRFLQTHVRQPIMPALMGTLSLLLSAGVALAAEPAPAERSGPTKEMREKMAAAHEQMATCLRSDRPIEECHEEMRKLHDSMGHDHMMGPDQMKEKPSATEPK